MAHDAAQYIKDRVFRRNLETSKERYGICGIGISVYERSEVLAAMSVKPPDIIQVPLNILDKRLLADDLLDEVRACGVEIQVRSVFLQGLLFLPSVILKQKVPSLAPILRKLSTIAAREGFSVPQMALIWVAGLNIADKVIIGINNQKQLLEHLRILGDNISSEGQDQIMSLEFNDEKVLDPRKW